MLALTTCLCHTAIVATGATRVQRSTVGDVLHQTANRAIHEHRFEDAFKCYHLALAYAEPSQTSRTHMLMALLHQRTGAPDEARAAFLAGERQQQQHAPVLPGAVVSSKQLKEDAQLWQAHGLFEQRQGNQETALELVTMAVAIDASLSKILQWKMFRRRDPDTRQEPTKEGDSRARSSGSTSSSSLGAVAVRPHAMRRGALARCRDLRCCASEPSPRSDRQALEELFLRDAPSAAELGVAARLPVTAPRQRALDTPAPSIASRSLGNLLFFSTAWMQRGNLLAGTAILVLFIGLYQSGEFGTAPSDEMVQRILSEEGAVTNVESYVLSEASSVL